MSFEGLQITMYLEKNFKIPKHFWTEF